MKLPSLPNEDFFTENDIKKKKIETKKDYEKDSKAHKRKPKETYIDERRPKIPKTEYDEDGRPILMVPDLDDVNLENELNKYFGDKESD